MKIDILVSTMNERINLLSTLVLPFHPLICYKISHQVSDNGHYSIPEFLKRDDIKVSQIYTKGLSKNRNNTLKMIENDICLIADDDVEYELIDLLKILGDYKNHEDVDFITYKIKTYKNEPYRKYKKKSFKHNTFTISKVSSIEITFRKESLGDIKFNESFGLGSGIFPSGEENLFLLNFLKNNYKGIYMARFIVYHDFESSGKKQFFDEKKALFTAVKFHKLYQQYSMFFIVYHILKYRKEYYKNNISAIKLINIMLLNKEISKWT